MSYNSSTFESRAILHHMDILCIILVMKQKKFHPLIVLMALGIVSYSCYNKQSDYSEDTITDTISMFVVDTMSETMCLDSVLTERKQGSAMALEGDIYVLTVYTGRNRWDEKKTDSFNLKLQEAEQWLQEQAQRYNKTVTFHNGCYGSSESVPYDVRPGARKGTESTDVIEGVMKTMGYQTTLDFVDWVKQEYGFNNCLVLVVADKTGVSYAIGYRNDYDKEKYYLEGAVLFTQDPDGGGLIPASIAHEMCHVFGAEDLYETFQQTKENEQLARKLYPDDIMLRISYDINELIIDEMTAWFVGLNDVEKSWYRKFSVEKKN